MYCCKNTPIDLKEPQDDKPIEVKETLNDEHFDEKKEPHDEIVEAENDSYDGRRVLIYSKDFPYCFWAHRGYVGVQCGEFKPTMQDTFVFEKSKTDPGKYIIKYHEGELMIEVFYDEVGGTRSHYPAKGAETNITITGSRDLVTFGAFKPVRYIYFHKDANPENLMTMSNKEFLWKLVDRFNVLSSNQVIWEVDNTTGTTPVQQEITEHHGIQKTNTQDFSKLASQKTSIEASLSASFWGLGFSVKASAECTKEFKEAFSSSIDSTYWVETTSTYTAPPGKYYVVSKLVSVFNSAIYDDEGSNFTFKSSNVSIFEGTKPPEKEVLKNGMSRVD